MNNLRRSVGLPVYFLSVVCALLIGFIAGHFFPEYRTKFEKELDLMDHYFKKLAGELGENTVRDDILFFGPDMENIGLRNYMEIPKGNTHIQGRVLLNGKPMEGLKLALLFAPKRKTQTVTTNTNGEYEISLPEDQYILYAILCYNQENELAGKICVNKLSGSWSDPWSDASPFNERTNRITPAIMPDINYRDPVQIVSPISASHEKLDQLRFSWTPYPGAASYIIEISNVEEQGDTRGYIRAMVSKVQKNSVDYAELLRTVQRNEFSGSENRMEEKKSYSIRVTALDVNGEIISASSENTFGGILFHID